MARHPREWRDIHKAADWIEPRMAARFERATAKMRAGISINELGLKIAAGDLKGAVALLPKTVVDEALAPVATMAREAVFRGGRIGAANLNRKLGE